MKKQSPTNIPIQERLGFLMQRTAGAMRNHMHRLIQSKSPDLSFEQWMALNWLVSHEQACQKEMAQAMDRDKANITRIVIGLEKKGLIQRTSDEKDGRMLRAGLTDQGRELMGRLMPPVLEEYQLLLEGLTDEELQVAKKVLNHLFVKLKQ